MVVASRHKSRAEETNQSIKQLEIMNNYTKGITLTPEELKALGGSIEFKCGQMMSMGCRTEKFKILNGIKKRLEEAKQ